MQTHDRTTRLRGLAVLADPLLNKGTAFTAEERRALHLDGLLPDQVSSEAAQLERAYATVMDHDAPLDRYVAMLALQNRNEYLFYKLLTEHLEQLMPIVYTPTVGLACQRFSHVFQRARGLWITPDMTGRVREVLAHAVEGRDVRLLVATDNESILGIGDQGAGGMAISVGKLALYVAGAGIAPDQTLPVSLDVGTDNESLRDDPLYLGWRQPRLRGAAYAALVDEFVDAVRAVCPDALLQWEDFRKDNAVGLQARYRDTLLSFNDDVQGTGAVALAGILSACQISEQSFSEQRILIYGAGAAGIGIARQIKSGLRLEGVEDPDSRVAVLDSAGLLVDDRALTDAYKRELAWTIETARRYGLDDDGARQLEDVVRGFQPTVLIGTSGHAGAFTREVVSALLEWCERPVVMPFSNPTDRAEATPLDVLEWTEGRALIATGSPFDPVERDGTRHVIGQGNNVFIFPGLGLGALFAESASVTDEMVSVAARAVAGCVSEEERALNMLYPAISRLREVSLEVAAAVAQQAIDQGCSNQSPEDLKPRIEQGMWTPDYGVIRAV